MVQKVLIFGITDLAELLFSYIESDPNYNVLGFVVDHQFQEKKEFCGKEVYTFENIDDNFLQLSLVSSYALATQNEYCARACL